MYPALAVAEAMVRYRPDSQVFLVGTVGGFERPLIEESGVSYAAYDEVQTGPMHGVNPFRGALSFFKIMVGTVQAFGLIRHYQPQALLVTGGWVSVPVALAAWLRRVPVLVYLPDIEPGLTIQLLKRIARCVAVTVDASRMYFRPGQAVVTGYPLRQAMAAAAQDGRARAIEHFKLDPNRKTVLVFGGSRGARSINLALLDILPDLLADGVQVLHVTGTLDWEQVEARTVGDTTHYHAFAYLHEDMGLAMAAADVVVCRAGASALGELPLFGVPSILVPYPHAWRYQRVNADYLAERGAAIRMNDDAMTQELLPTLRSLLTDPARWAAMHDQAAALAQPEGAWRVAQIMLQWAGEAA